MAKKPPAKPRRTASRLPAEQVQPGAVASQLAPNAAGESLAEDDASDDHAAASTLAERRQEFLSIARKRFKRSYEAESQLRMDMLDDMEFYNSDQWPDHVKMERMLDKRPILTINRLPQFVRQVVNQARQSKPAIQINPVDNGADVDTAEVFQGICRQIERQSKAHIAYSTAQEHQAIMGRGFIRVLAEYATDNSMEQEIRIKRVMDALTVYPDPACAEPDYSDSTFCFIIERVPREEYRLRYGEEAMVNSLDFSSLGVETAQWLNEDGIQIAEYFYIDQVKTRIADVQINTTPPSRVVVDRSILTAEDISSGRVTIIKERETIKRQVKWALINGIDVLEGNPEKTAGRDLPGPWIPVVPVLGEELVVRGRKNLRGMVRDAKDPQRSYNFWVSAETEMIALAPRAPVIGAVGQFENLETKWNESNRRNFAYLEYNPMDVNGMMVPAPQRAAFDPNIGPIVQATRQADTDLKSVIGMFDASQEASQEQSGKAIIARQKQGEEGTSHFLDNLSRSIEQVGRILVSWIPIYYDKPRMLRILGEDDTERTVMVHAGQGQAAQDEFDRQKATQDEDAALRKNVLEGRPFDLSVGRYDVTISVGPSYQSRRQETVDAILQLINSNPALAPVVSDILVGNMDWPGAKQLAKRLKKIVPPEVLAAESEDGGPPPIPPEIQQQMQAMQQQLDAALAALAEKDEIIKTKAQELAAQAQIKMADIHARTREVELKQQLELMKLHVQTQSEAALTMLKSRLDAIQQRLDHAHEEKMVALGAALEPGQAPEQPSHPSETINYKDTPPDVQRQLEAAAGLVPSKLPPPKPEPAKPAPKKA
jgi:hypothetical protein